MISAHESQVHARNFAHTVKQGRDPALTLNRDGVEVPLKDWALELIERIRPLAQLLDEGHNEDGVHANSLGLQKAKIDNPALTPSARVLEEIRALGSASAFGLRQSELHAAAFRDSPLMPAEEALFEEMVAASLAEQATIEAADTGSFDDFVAAYNSSTLCGNQ